MENKLSKEYYEVLISKLSISNQVICQDAIALTFSGSKALNIYSGKMF
jgi:hypothetical protein